MLLLDVAVTFHFVPIESLIHIVLQTAINKNKTLDGHFDRFWETVVSLFYVENQIVLVFPSERRKTG